MPAPSPDRPGGSRFDVRIDPGPPATVTKTGAARSLAREAQALRRVADLGCAPGVVATGAGRLVTDHIAGRARTAETLTPAEGRRLGRVIRAVHEHRRTATGGLAGWPSRARSLAAYRRGRLRDLLRAADGSERSLAERVAATTLRTPAPHGTAFHLLHGDLTLANIVWDPRPRLIDWEFWRMGDPAEDLAYLAEVNRLPAATFASVLGGYGLAGMATRVDGWRALVALDAALWYRAHGDAVRAEPLHARADALAA